MIFQFAVLALLLLCGALLIGLWLQGRHRAAALGALGDRLELRIRDQARALFGQLEAYLSLRDRLDLRHGLPYSHNWSAAPDFLKLITDHALNARPATIVECSSGLTSLMLARCCAINGGGKVFSLEHGSQYAAATRTELERYDVAEYATVIDAPLIRHTCQGQDYQWYTVDDLPRRAIDMLVIDGPPGFTQHHARFPALPLLFDRLAEGCVVFLDDAARPDEREIVAQWLSAYPDIEHDYLGLERGCSVLRIHRPSPLQSTEAL